MKIDTSGLSCPEPVLRTKKALKESPDTIEVVVDNETALRNVIRFLNHNKYTATNNGFVITGKK